MAYTVTSGVIPSPVKVVLYGPEGIGKSTFASKFPAPVFIDTESGTKRLNVARLPAPTGRPASARVAACPAARPRPPAGLTPVLLKNKLDKT